MAANVRIAIKNYEVFIAAMNDKVDIVLGGICFGDAEDAGTTGIFGTGCADVFVPPRTPEYFHE